MEQKRKTEAVSERLAKVVTAAELAREYDNPTDVDRDEEESQEFTRESEEGPHTTTLPVHRHHRH